MDPMNPAQPVTRILIALCSSSSSPPVKAAVLKSATVAPDRLEAWIEERVKQGVDVLVRHPRLVQTGLDLVGFPTICWQETDYSVFQWTQTTPVLLGSGLGCNWG